MYQYCSIKNQCKNGEQINQSQSKFSVNSHEPIKSVSFCGSDVRNSQKNIKFSKSNFHQTEVKQSPCTFICKIE